MKDCPPTFTYQACKASWMKVTKHFVRCRQYVWLCQSQQLCMFKAGDIACGHMPLAVLQGSGRTPRALAQGLEGYDAIALIIDDTSRVWPDHARNLLAVERYLWFPAARRQFRLTGPSLMEQRRCRCAQPLAALPAAHGWRLCWLGACAGLSVR